jgi:DNA-binding response OmpR family regulator
MPTVPDDSAASASAAEGAAEKPKATLLVIDDDDLVRSFVVRVLQGAGYDVLQAGNGREALRQVRAGKLDLVITDIVMPDMDGFETIRELRRIDGKVPVMAMSGGGKVDPHTYLDLARQFGARQILEKPFDRDMLLEKVEAILGAAPKR